MGRCRSTGRGRQGAAARGAARCTTKLVPDAPPFHLRGQRSALALEEKALTVGAEEQEPGQRRPCSRRRLRTSSRASAPIRRTQMRTCSASSARFGRRSSLPTRRLRRKPWKSSSTCVVGQQGCARPAAARLRLPPRPPAAERAAGRDHACRCARFGAAALTLRSRVARPRLAQLQMFGRPMHWASFNVVECISSVRDRTLAVATPPRGASPPASALGRTPPHTITRSARRATSSTSGLATSPPPSLSPRTLTSSCSSPTC